VLIKVHTLVCYNWLTSNMFRPYSVIIRLTTDGAFAYLNFQLLVVVDGACLTGYKHLL